MEIIVLKPNYEDIEKLETCPIWECKVSVFDWAYEDQEIALIIDGEAEIGYGDQKTVTIRGGDMVIFPSGMSCVWNVKSPIKKHYMLSK